MALLKKKDYGQAAWFFKAKPAEKLIENGWRFALKGSPRHYDDVNKIVESDPGAHIYFKEALTYERGAGVALWRIEATTFDWLPRLYAWWAEMERVEPILFTFFLYHLPSGLILYWVVSNIISIGQSYLTKRIIAAHMAEHEAKSKSGGNPPAVARKDDEGKQQGAIART